MSEQANYYRAAAIIAKLSDEPWLWAKTPNDPNTYCIQSILLSAAEYLEEEAEFMGDGNG